MKDSFFFPKISLRILIDVTALHSDVLGCQRDNIYARALTFPLLCLKNFGSSIGTALHRYRRCHGFESCSSLNVFFSQLQYLCTYLKQNSMLSWQINQNPTQTEPVIEDSSLTQACPQGLSPPQPVTSINKRTSTIPLRL